MKCLGAVLVLVALLFASPCVQACDYGSTALVLSSSGHCRAGASVFAGSYGSLALQSYSLPVQSLAVVRVRSAHYASAAANVLVVERRPSVRLRVPFASLEIRR